MAASVIKQHAARWQVVTPWTKGDVTADVVAAEITTEGNEITIKLIGNNRPITFPVERAKMLLSALGDAVATAEATNAPST